MVDKCCVQGHSSQVAPMPGDTGGGHGRDGQKLEREAGDGPSRTCNTAEMAELLGKPGRGSEAETHPGGLGGRFQPTDTFTSAPMSA